MQHGVQQCSLLKEALISVKGRTCTRLQVLRAPRVLQVGYSMPPAAVPGVTSTTLYACYSVASAYDRPWRQANDVLAVRLGLRGINIGESRRVAMCASERCWWVC